MESQSPRQHHKHDVDLLDHNAVWKELGRHFLADDFGHLSFSVSNPVDFEASDEITNVFLALLLQELFKPVWTKVIEELDDVLFFHFFSLVSLSDVEINTNV